MYCPPNNNLSSAETLYETIERVVRDHPNSVIWIAGDLNLPNVCWNNWTVNDNNYPLALCNLFIDLFVILMDSVNLPYSNHKVIDLKHKKELQWKKFRRTGNSFDHLTVDLPRQGILLDTLFVL